MMGRPSELFWKLYSNLPQSAQEATLKSLRLWADNPRYPSLGFKKVKGFDNLYSLRVGLHWRALGYVESDVPILNWIGSHADYSWMLKRK